MTRAMIAGFALLALSALPAAADEKLDCAHAQAQQEMNQCAGQDFDRADAALNKAYKKALSGLDAANSELLRKAQRAWLAYRDAQCTFEAAPNTGGSIYPLIYSGCLTRLTRERTKQIAQGQQ